MMEVLFLHLSSRSPNFSLGLWFKMKSMTKNVLGEVYFWLEASFRVVMFVLWGISNVYYFSGCYVCSSVVFFCLGRVLSDYSASADKSYSASSVYEYSLNKFPMKYFSSEVRRSVGRFILKLLITRITFSWEWLSFSRCEISPQKTFSEVLHPVRRFHS